MSSKIQQSMSKNKSNKMFLAEIIGCTHKGCDWTHAKSPTWVLMWDGQSYKLMGFGNLWFSVRMN